MARIVAGVVGWTRAQLIERVGWLEDDNAQLRAERDHLRGQVERLQAELDEARRAGKRQAAPFSKGPPVANPKRPGRKPGSRYGTRAWRRPPEQVDRVVDVAVPECCPHCGGRLVDDGVVCQYLEDLPEVRSVRTRYDLHTGRCGACGRRSRPRHPEQVSGAVGAAGSMLGPNVVALAVWLRVGLGLSAVKVCQVLARLGVTVTPGGLTTAIARTADRAGLTYQALEQAVRDSPVVAPDETGWRVGGQRGWLWALVGQQVVVYRIATGAGARGFAEAAAVLGEGYQGVLERDGWVAYRGFAAATHQSCLAHLVRRCDELIAQAGDDTAAARLPGILADRLRGLLKLRDQVTDGHLDRGELHVQAAVTGVVVDRLIAQGAAGHEPNRRLLGHLERERHALFTFAFHDGVQATNWRAEQAIRPAVVTRKVWGGNRTPTGAATWQTLASVLATATLQHRDGVQLLVGLLRSATPTVADLARPARGP